jgi:UDP-N-acetylglucosamine acyltransferase
VVSSSVHPSAVVDPSATLGQDVVIGPFCHVGAGVVLGDGCHLVGSATVLGPTVLGARNVVHPYAVLGGAPQDKSHRGEPTRLVIGDDNVFREHVTVNRGTTKQDGVTRIGSGNLLMAGSHIAHDCVLGDGIILGNGTLLGGHVEVRDYVVSGGGVAIQPFVTIGTVAFLAGGAMIEREVPPFVIAAGDRARVRGLNKVGLRRRGVSPESLRALRTVYAAWLLPSSGKPGGALDGDAQAARSADPLAEALWAACAALAARR